MYVTKTQYKKWKERFYQFLEGEYRNDKNDANANNRIARPTLLKNYIWGDEMKEFGIKLMLEEAGLDMSKAYKDYILSKLIYIHDAGSGKVFKPYCFAFETKNVRLYGLPISPEPKTPAKHANVFVDHVAMLIHSLSQIFAGAVTPIDFLIQLSYFTKDLSDKEVRQLMQMFIHIINDDIREVDGSPFVNINIFDKPALKRLFDVEDDLIPEVDRIQRLYIDVFTERPRNGGIPYTFPVTTIQLSFDEEGNPLDKEYLKLASTYPHLWYIYHNYGDIKAISTCCFDGCQTCLTKSSNGVCLCSFEELYNSGYYDKKENFRIFHNGSWIKGKLVKYKNNNGYMYEITTSNNKKLIVTHDHIHPTLEGDKLTTELTTNDYLLFNTLPLEMTNTANSNINKERNLTYEQGYLIGLYLGDGSAYKRKNCESYSITFSLNHKKNEKSLPIIKKALEQWDIDSKISVCDSDNNVMSVTIISKKLYDIVKYFVKGNYAHEKEINLDVLLYSSEFRRGIIYGWYDSDGGNSNRIYTTSKKLVEQMEAVFTSLGLITIIDVVDRTGKGKVVINGEKFNRNYPLYCIRWYDIGNKRKMKDIYIIKNNSVYVKIKDIKKLEVEQDKDVYCFEVNNLDEPYFTLPNGVITHNCRLRNDLSFIQEVTKHKIGSLGTANAQIGSHRVISLNLPKIIKKGGFELLDDILENVVYPLLKAHRKIMRKEIKKGVLPYFRCKKYNTLERGGWFDLDTMFFSTVGLIGLYEASVYLAGNKEDNLDEILKYEKEIAKFIREKTDKWSKQDLLPYGVELVPAENAGAVLSDTNIPLSTQYLPFWKHNSVYDRLKFAGNVDEYCNGGTVTFLPIGNIPKPETVEKVIKFAGKKRIYYYTFNPVYTICQECGKVSFGKTDKCFYCGSENVDYITRVTGWYTPVSNWNDKKKNEFKIRQIECING